MSESGNINTSDLQISILSNSITQKDVPEWKLGIRKELVGIAEKLIGLPYKFGAEHNDMVKLPSALDCSEMVEWLYHCVGLKDMPDGSQAQFYHTLPTDFPLCGDLAFFGRDGDSNQIYHVGMVFDNERIIEARAYDATATFETGKVIFRPRLNWEKYKNFCGYRVHPKLVRDA